MESGLEDATPLTPVSSQISLTSRAVTAARELVAADPELRDKPLRLYLDGKGCDGFYYGVTFGQKETEDVSWDCDGITVIVDPRTLVFVDGSMIDWIDDERGRGFLVDNPQQKRFRGKFFKKSVWQQKLKDLDA